MINTSVFVGPCKEKSNKECLGFLGETNSDGTDDGISPIFSQ